MGLLVCEIMSLPAMKDAAVLAGNAGLYNAVETIGTIDIFECLEHSLEHYETLSLNGHIMLTAMLTGWPIETQCACLSFLKASGASGIILFSLPDHAVCIDPVFLQKADELQLPVIRMPDKQWSYSEIITPIINAIIHKENEHFQLSYPTLMKLANVSKEKQSAAFLLETLSRDTMVSIALLDGEFAPQHRAELSQVFTDFFTGADFRAAAERAAAEGQGEFTGANGQTIYFSCQQMFLYNSRVRYLVAASNTAPVSAAQQNWIAEVISFFFAAWNINKTGHNSLAISILEGDQVGARSLAKALNIDLNRISIFYLFHPTRRLSQQELDRYYSRIEKYVSQFMSRPVMAKYGTGIAVFLEMPQYPLDIFDFTEELQKELAEYGGDYVLFRHTQEELAYEKFFAAALASMEDARRVYPHKQVFSLQELRFVRACADTVAQGQDSIAQSLEILKPLMKKQNWAGDLWHTLAAYLLDAECSVEKVAHYLQVHPSTVKYRMNRIRELLGYSIQKVPEAYYLSTAVAVSRLLDMYE